jgi:urease accessory protein
MDENSANGVSELDRALPELWLLHLADSALPIGAFAHSFGVESLVAEGSLQVPDLRIFLKGWLEEAGVAEAVFCRSAFSIGGQGEQRFPADHWLDMNDCLGALKPARESRQGSAVLGRNFLRAVLAVGDFPRLRQAAAASQNLGGAVHHATAFGLVSAVLRLNQERAVGAYLHQSVAGFVSACQRLMPLGQTQAMQILWDLKPFILEAAQRSNSFTVDDVCCFLPLLDCGAMEHPALFTRLFIS